MGSARTGAVQMHIDAPAETVWAILADVERMGEWSPECYRVEWLDGARSPATVGARFRGWNRFGMLRWSMLCRVTSAEPGRELSWTTVDHGKDETTWAYRLTPSASGVDLVESFAVSGYTPTARLAEDFLMRDRDRRRLEGMQRTLQRIKQVAESARDAASQRVQVGSTLEA